MGGLLGGGGGGQRVCWPPPPLSNYWGGTWPPSSYAYETIFFDIRVLFEMSVFEVIYGEHVQ